MRTLVFCTAYAPTQSVWDTRYRMWLDAVQALGADQVLLVDDGSPVLPGWRDLHIFSGDVIGEGFTTGPRGKQVLFHFRRRLGRADVLDFPGWHRSFVFAALYAEANGFERVVHLESDAFLLTERARTFVSSFSDGWVALYAPRFDMPESAIQVAAGDGLHALAAFARRPYGAMVGRQHEHEMPFTGVERSLAGDRIGETAEDMPAGLDYAAQLPSRREAGFYHWLPGHVRRVPAQSVTLHFCEGGDGLAALGDGWANPEPRHHWMLGAESVLHVPGLPGDGPAVLRMGVTPHVFGDVLTRQRLIVEVNGFRVRSFDIMLECVVGCDIPAEFLRPGDRNVVRLIHPDAVAPSVLAHMLSDHRRISVSVEWVTVER